MHRGRTLTFLLLGVLLTLFPSGFSYAVGKAADLMCFSGSQYDYSCPWKNGQKEIKNGKEVICMQEKPCDDSDVKGGCISASFCGGEKCQIDGEWSKCSLPKLTTEGIQQVLQGQSSSLTPPAQTPENPSANPNTSILGQVFSGAPSSQGPSSAQSATNFNDLIMQSGTAPGGLVPNTGGEQVPGSLPLSPTPSVDDAVQLQGGTVPGVNTVQVETSAETGGTAGGSTFQQPTQTDQQLLQQAGTFQPQAGEAPAAAEAPAGCSDFDFICKAQVALGFKSSPDQGSVQPENTQTMNATIYYPGCVNAPANCSIAQEGGLQGSRGNTIDPNLTIAAGRESGLKYGDVVQLTNPATGQTTNAVVGDVCPACGKGVDLTPGVANALGLTQAKGVASMEVGVVSPGLPYNEGLKLAGNLNTGATFPGNPVVVADNSPFTTGPAQFYGSQASIGVPYFDTGLQNGSSAQEPPAATETFAVNNPSATPQISQENTPQPVVSVPAQPQNGADMDTKTPEQLQVIQQQQLAERQLQADAQAPKPSDMDAKTQAELQSIQQQQLAERLAQAPTNTGSANTTADAEAPATTRLVWGLAEYGATGDATEMKEAWNDIWNPKSTPDSVPKEFSPFDTSITAGAQYGFTPVPDLGAPPQVPQVPQTEPSAPAPQISQAEPAPIVVASNDPTVVPSTPEPTTPTAAPDATPAKTGNSDITASADDARLQPAPATPSAPIGETGYKGGSVANYLDSAHMDSSFAAREQLAAKYGITGYSGTTVQNTQLLKTLRGY